MASANTGRTVNRWIRAYYDGYDVSGYTRSIGPLQLDYELPEMTCYADAIKTYLPNHPNGSVGTLNGVLDNTAGALHALAQAGNGTSHIVTCVIGVRAEPLSGDPAFTGRFEQNSYQAVDASGAIAINAQFGMWDASNEINYANLWGMVLHANDTETTANTDVGFDNDQSAATTAFGGFFWYHLISADGSVTLSVDDAATNLNASFAPLVGATSGLIAAAPAVGIVAIGTTATVRQFLRWQLAFTGGSTATFVCGFNRRVKI